MPGRTYHTTYEKQTQCYVYAERDRNSAKVDFAFIEIVTQIPILMTIEVG